MTEERTQVMVGSGCDQGQDSGCEKDQVSLSGLTRAQGTSRDQAKLAVRVRRLWARLGAGSSPPAAWATGGTCPGGFLGVS